MDSEKCIDSIADEVKTMFTIDRGGHDWWHIYRVWRLASFMAEKENADVFVVELAALLHDIADWKFNNGDEYAGGKAASKMLSAYSLSPEIIARVSNIIDQVSFKGAGVKSVPDSLEGRIVQDADRLDAIGAIGIARTFAYGGMKGRSLYDPAVKPQFHDTFESYKISSAPTINHFYEKLLLLKELMNTETAKQLACERHSFMEQFLAMFYKEWDFCTNE
jgi:uncharacterized protein